MMNRSKLTIRQVTEMRKLRATGVSLSELAARYDVSDVAIHRHVKDVPPPPGGWKKSGSPRRFDRARAARLKAQGATYAELGARFGVSPWSVFKGLKAHRAQEAA